MSLLTGSWCLDALLVLVALLYWYTTRNNSFWKNLGVPHMKPKLLVGNMGGVVLGRKHMGDPIYDCYREAGDRHFMGMFAFDQPLLVVKHPELVGRVLAKDFISFNTHNFTLGDKEDSVISRTLFASGGDRWRALRSKLTPGFTSGKMKRMFQLVEVCARDLVEYIEAAETTSSNIEVQEMTACYTTDVVCSVFIGVEGGCLQDSNSPMRQSLGTIFRDDYMSRLAFGMAFMAPKLLNLLKLKVISKEAEEYLIKISEKTMEHRKENGIVREDAIDMLMRIVNGQMEDERDDTKLRKKSDETFSFDSKDMAAQILAFLQAGFETSASTMMFSIYELALNQELQDRVRRQVEEVKAEHGNKITYEGLAEMTELNNVVKEALRKYPVLNFIDRRTTQDYHIPGTSVVIPKDTGVLISVMGLHYDPRYWQQPHRFDPDRFKEENFKRLPNYVYLPFGDGPRYCIGMRLGLMQVCLGLAHILSNFRMVPTSRTPVPLTLDASSFILKPKGPLPLRFQSL